MALIIDYVNNNISVNGGGDVCLGGSVPGGGTSLEATCCALISSGSGGNARGNCAVDFQRQRALVTQVASGERSAILSGYGNLNDGSSGAIVTGFCNSIGTGGSNNIIAGGRDNNITAQQSFIGGGKGNTTSGSYGFIGSGCGGTITSSNYSVIVGGCFNRSSAKFNVILGGATNSNSGEYSIVLGGRSNTSGGIYNIVGSGFNNTNEAACAGIFSGISHKLFSGGKRGFIGGGCGNTISNCYQGVIAGGASNIINGTSAGILSGANNQARASYSSVVAGINNYTTGVSSFIGNGQTNTILAANNSFIGSGAYNTVSGGYGMVLGGRNNTVSASYGLGLGAYSIANKYSQQAYSSGRFAVDGDAQTSQFAARLQTTDATQSELFLDGASERLTIATDTTWAFHVLITARRTDADGESAAYELKGCIDNNAGTTALVGSLTKTVLAEDTVGWDVTAEADDTNDALVIKVTGEAAKTINWVAFVRTVEVTG